MELSIGQNVNLTQEAPALDHVLVGLRWRTDEPLLRESLEAGVLLTSNGKLVSRQDFVFAHQVLDRAGSVRRRELMGDDQVQFDLHLPTVPQDVDSLEVVLFTNGESTVRLNRASGIRARMINPATGKTMFRAPLVQVGRSAAVRLMQVYRHRGEWKVRLEWHSVSVHASRVRVMSRYSFITAYIADPEPKARPQASPSTAAATTNRGRSLQIFPLTSKGTRGRSILSGV